MSQKRQFIILLTIVVLTFALLGIGAAMRKPRHRFLRPHVSVVKTSVIPFEPYLGPTHHLPVTDPSTKAGSRQ